MTSTDTEIVTLDELRALFTGVPEEGSCDEEWATTPCYTIPLAVEVCRRTGADTEHSLRSVLFDATPVDEIPKAALITMQLAVTRFRQLRAARTRSGL